MQLPPAIIYINNDINDLLLTNLKEQLYIHEVLTDVEFDTLVSTDPTYPDQVHLNGIRLLVIRNDFRDYTNRELADVVIFISHGLANIEKNKFGPPSLALPIYKLNIYELLRGAGSSYVIILPQNCKMKYNCCKCSCKCVILWGYGGIIGIEMRAGDPCGVHTPNCDNEYNNEAFINRK